MTYMETVWSRDTVLPSGLLFGAFGSKEGRVSGEIAVCCVDAHGNTCLYYIHTIPMLLDAAEKHEPARDSVRMRIQDAYSPGRDAISANWPPQMP